jgi:SAM-dependent methyltransferase
MLGALIRSLKRKSPLGRSRAELLNQTQPASRVFGLDRGKAIDRYYIEDFLSGYREDIRGHVLEVEHPVYTRMFGGNRVCKTDVLHAVDGNPEATIIADLAAADSIASETFDCIVLTQTLQFVYDLHGAVQHLYRILKSGGVLLATVPGISQISQFDEARWGDYWRFTRTSASRLFEEAFDKKSLDVRTRGNALAASAFLHGLAAEELRPDELALNDPDYEMLITIRGVRS